MPNPGDWKKLIADNERAWDLRTPHHVASDFYDMKGFERGDCSLTPPELRLTGDVAGKSLLHLQCHFGQDSLSWARRGARVVGVDFSGEAVRTANALAERLALDASFVKADVLALRETVRDRFDVVFTSWGVLGWLPELGPWAEGIAASLAPNGRFVLVEFHPYVWMSQSGPDSSIRYSYFNRGPITEQTSGTYADREAPIQYVEHGWNHSLADVLGALLRAGLRIEAFEEYDCAWHGCFPNLTKAEDGTYRFTEAMGMVPMSYGVVATKAD